MISNTFTQGLFNSHKVEPETINLLNQEPTLKN